MSPKANVTGTRRATGSHETLVCADRAGAVATTANRHPL